MIWELLTSMGLGWSVLFGTLMVWSLTAAMLRWFGCHQLRTAQLAISDRLGQAGQAWRRVRGAKLAELDTRCTQAANICGSLGFESLVRPRATAAPELAAQCAPDRQFAAADRQLRTIAAVSPLLGLAGTVAGYRTMLARLGTQDLADSFAAVAKPASLAMTTTLSGLIPTVIAMLALYLIVTPAAAPLQQLAADTLRESLGCADAARRRRRRVVRRQAAARRPVDCDTPNRHAVRAATDDVQS